MDPTVGYWPVKETQQWPISSAPAQKAKDLLDGFAYSDATLPHTHTTYEPFLQLLCLLFIF